MAINFNQIDQNKQSSETQSTDKAAIKQELKKVAEMQELENKTFDKSYDKNFRDAKKLESIRDEKGFQAKLHKDPGIKVLSSLAKDLAKIGLDINPQNVMSNSTKTKLNKELDKIANKAMDEDKFDSKNKLTDRAITGVGEKEERRKEEKRDSKELATMLSSGDVKETMKDFSAAFAQNILNASPEARDKLDDAKSRLRKKGFSDKEMISMERAVKKTFGKQLLGDVQDAFIQHMFSPKNTFEFVVTSRQLNNTYEEAAGAKELTGISKDPQVIKQEMARIGQNAQTEIKDFVRDAVESKLMEKHINDIDNKGEVKKLVALGQKVGFDFVQFTKTWEQKKMDMGLVIIEIVNDGNAQASAQLSVGDVKSGGVGDKSGYEMSKDDERELLVNQLRAEFMNKALSGDPFSVFRFEPKIRKLKNGIIRLGLEMRDIDKIEQEAKAIARFKTLEMLKDAFVERATYYELSGPSFNLLNSKMKGMIANLDKLGLKLDKEQVDFIRNETNRQMHDHTIIEMKSALSLLKSNPNEKLEEKVPLMAKLVDRLREESGFKHDLGEQDLDSVILKFKNNQKGLKEDV